MPHQLINIRTLAHVSQAFTKVTAADYRFYFESVPNAMILVLATDYTMLAANDVWCAATAIPREDAIGKNLFDVFPDNPEDLNADGVSHVRASLDRVLRENTTDVMPMIKYDIELPDGSFEERFWTITNSPLYAPDGSIAAILNRADDVTDYVRLKQTEEAAAAIVASDSASIESIVVRQTREAAASSRELKDTNAELARLNREAREATEKLGHANRDLEQFAYVVSHDLQAPVRNIAGLVELLRERFDDAELSEEDQYYFRLLEQSTTRMLDQIQGLLKISRLQTNQPTWARVDLAKIVNDAIATESEAIAATNATVTIVGELPQIDADPVQLSLLFQNLIGNAIKYRQLDVAPIVEISASETSDDIELCIKDNGIGIAADHQERIFRIFQRLHSPRDTTYTGTGIGLALVLKIVKIHRGEVWVASDGKGTGSTFHVKLPLTQNRVDTTETEKTE